MGTTKNFGKDLPLESTIAETAQKLSSAENALPLQVSDVAALVRHLCRQISIKNEAGSGQANLSKKVYENEELRKNIIIISKEVEKHVEQVPPKFLNDFTNLLNVFRNNDLEITNSLRNAVSKRARQLFQEKEFAEQVRELTFEQASKILSDMLHHGSVQQIALRFINMIPDRKVAKKDESMSGDTMLKNINSLMRVVDSIGANPNQVESLDFLIRRIERYLRQEENFNLLNVNQATRVLKTFAFAAHTNLMRIPLLEMLVRKIH